MGCGDGANEEDTKLLLRGLRGDRGLVLPIGCLAGLALFVELVFEVPAVVVLLEVAVAVVAACCRTCGLEPLLPVFDGERGVVSMRAQEPLACGSESCFS